MLLRELNFMCPVYASCFANYRGDILVGYGQHVWYVQFVDSTILMVFFSVGFDFIALNQMISGILL